MCFSNPNLNPYLYDLAIPNVILVPNKEFDFSVSICESLELAFSSKGVEPLCGSALIGLQINQRIIFHMAFFRRR